MLSAQGIEAVLAQVAAGSTESRLDEVTVMEGWTADGATLRYGYRVDAELDGVPPVLRESVARDNCATEFVRTLMGAGAPAPVRGRSTPAIRHTAIKIVAPGGALRAASTDRSPI